MPEERDRFVLYKIFLRISGCKLTVKTLTTKNFEKEIDNFSQGKFRCRKCQKFQFFENTEQIQVVQCESCGQSQLGPKKIGKFWLTELLKQNDSGDYYLAPHEDFHHRLFTVKVLPEGSRDDSNRIKKLECEADYVRKLGVHPHILGAVESGVDGGFHYLANEYVEGERLDHRLGRLGVLSEIEATMIVLQILSAEAHILNCGFLYRNINPENIVFSSSTGAYLFGFELCTPVKKAEEEPLNIEDQFSFFMPPERILGKGGERIHRDLCLRNAVLSVFNRKNLFFGR